MASQNPDSPARPYTAPGAVPGFGWGWLAAGLWIALAAISAHLIISVAGQQERLSRSINWWRKADQYLRLVQDVEFAAASAEFRLDREGFVEQFPPQVDAELASSQLYNSVPLDDASTREPVLLWFEANGRLRDEITALREDAEARVRAAAPAAGEVAQHLNRTMRMVTSDMADRAVELDANRDWLYITAVLAIVAAGALIFLNYVGWQKQRALAISATALQVSESRYRNMFQENRTIQMVLHPASEQILDANHAACDFYGLSLPELTAMRLPELGASGAPSPRGAEESPGAPREMQHRLSDGQIRHVEVRMSPFTVHGGQLLYVIIHDVTERYRAERALRDSEERFRTLAENVPGVVYLARADQRMTVEYVNARAADLTQCAEIEFLTGEVTMLELVAPADRQRVAEEMHSAVRAGRQFFVEHTLVRADGSERVVQQHGQPVQSPSSNEQLIEVALFDVTERKVAQQALQAEQVRLGVTLRSMADGVFSVDPDGRIMLMNEAAAGITGWDIGKAIGEPLTGVYQAAEETTGAPQAPRLERLLAGEDVETPAALALAKQGGGRVLVTESSAPIRTPEGELLGYVFVIRDVTEKRRMEERILRAERLDSLGVLAGGIAHDFNNILAGIIGNFSLARLHMHMPEIRDDRLDKAETAAVRARDLTKQLLTLSKGSMPVRRTASVAELVEETAGFALRGSNVKSQITVAEDLWNVKVDTGQISQVLHNLVLNADQAMPGGGGLTVTAENVSVTDAELLPTGAGRYIRLRVVDTGVGIPAENIERIFDPYFTTKETGSGLGLASCYSIVRNHDGAMLVDSVLGEGTTFDVYLPAAHDAVDEVEDAPVAQPRDGLNVLLMDDDAVIRDVAGAMLTSMGCVVTAADTGDEAVQLYEQAHAAGTPYDLTILDLTVPGAMGGRECMERITAIDPDVRAVVSSGYLNDPAMMTPRKFGFCGILPKPYTKEELAALVAETLPAGS